MLYWGIFTVGFYLGIIFNLVLWSRKDKEDEGFRREDAHYQATREPDLAGGLTSTL